MSCAWKLQHTNGSHLIIMWWQLVQELLNSEFLSRTVHVGNLLLRKAGEI